MSATAQVSKGMPLVFEELPLRRSFLKALRLNDPAPIDDGEVSDPEQHPKKTPKKAKTPKSSKKNGGKTPNLAALMTDEMKKAKKASTVTPKRGRGRPKKVVELNDDSNSESQEETPVRVVRSDPRPWYKGPVTASDLAIQKITYSAERGGCFIGKYKILDLVEVDERRGGTYIAFSDGYEVVLRVNFIQKDDMELLNTEAKFLEMMELNGVQHFVSTLFDLGVVNKEKVDGKAFYATIYRGGPTLQQCHTLRRGKFRSATVDRLGSQMIKIFEQICGLGYRMLSLSVDDFTIDRRSREIFLNNYANIVKAEGLEKEDFDDERVEEMIRKEKKRRIGWEGDEDFAPRKWHEQGGDHVMSALDMMESLVYMLIHLHSGLPWKDRADKAELKEVEGDKNIPRALINHLPPSLKVLWHLIRNADRLKFPLVYAMFTRFTTDKEDFRYDWEVVDYPSDGQEKLIHLHDKIRDTQRRMKTAEGIIDNAAQLAKR